MTEDPPKSFPPDGEAVKREREFVLRELERFEVPKPIVPERTE